MPDLTRFSTVFQLPPAMEPYVDLVATCQEQELVLVLDEHAMAVEEIAEALAFSWEEANSLVRNAWRRDIIEKDDQHGAVVYRPGKFYDTMDYWTSYETGTWLQLSPESRNAISEWQMQEWLALWAPAIDQIKKDPDAYVRMKNRDVLLLEDALDLVGAADHICLLPCPCKTTLMPGSPVIEGSMRVGERARVTLEKGQGRRLSATDAQRHLVALDRAGLVHTGPKAWRAHDPEQEWISHGNCHPSYSFPWRAGERLGLQKAYPRVHYRAQVDWSRCSFCSRCVARCPFGAFFHTGAVAVVRGERVRQIVFDRDRCWGCGLCANSCPMGIIEMQPL